MTRRVSRKVGIYVVDVTVQSGSSRYMLLADSAENAAAQVAHMRGYPAIEPFNVGRLGDYDPGFEGARITARGNFLAIVLDSSDPVRTIERHPTNPLAPLAR